MNSSQATLLDPYRSVGAVLSSCFFFQQTPPCLVASTNKSYKIYSPDLKIQNISPVFPDSIKGISSHSNSMLVRTGTKLLKMSYSHIVREWELGYEVTRSDILIFGELILLG